MSNAPDPLSISQCVAGLRAGAGAEAARHLHAHFFDLLVPVARKRLRSLRRLDEADLHNAVDSALDACFRKLRGGHYPDVHDRHDLWRLLAAVTARKANDLRKRHNALKRGGGRVLGESALAPAAAESSAGAPGGLDALPAPGPTPDEEAAWQEACRVLLERLEDPRYVEAVVMRMRGHSVADIVAATGHSRASVDRWLRYARDVLRELLAAGD